jgi:hypothetical protein
MFMVLTDRHVARATEPDEKILIFDVSDDALERLPALLSAGKP